MTRKVPDLIRRYLPILDWAAEYSSKMLVGDLVAAAIVTIMLIPQSLAYALLVGLPPQVGLYASMAPLVLYAIFGSSRALAVGPVAVASLMTAAAAGTVATQGTPEYLGAAIAIATVSGLMLVVMGLLRLGFLANFLSHPVISGFITAAAIQIAAGQLAPLLGIRTHGENLLDLLIPLNPTSSRPILIPQQWASPRLPSSSGCEAASSPFWSGSGLMKGPPTSWPRQDLSWPLSGPRWPSEDSGLTDVGLASSVRSPRVFLTSDCQPSTVPSGRERSLSYRS